MIIKKSKSGRQFHAVATEDIPAGTVFVCPAKSARMLIDESLPANFLLLQRFPGSTRSDRWDSSPVVLPDEGWKEVSFEEAVKRGIVAARSSRDEFSKESQDERRKKKAFDFSGDGW